MKNSFFKNTDGTLKQCQICVPLISNNLPTLKQEIMVAVKEGIDLLEWRVDKFAPINTEEELLLILSEISSFLELVPILFTWRSHRDGGEYIADTHYKNLITWAINSGEIAVVDIELSFDKDELAKLNNYAQSKGVETIISQHNFENTPTLIALKQLLDQLITVGGNAVKVAVMPQSTRDVINVMQATVEFKERYPMTPLVAISMGELGAITRLWAHRLETAFTFTTIEKKSAPGQVSVIDFKRFVGIM